MADDFRELVRNLRATDRGIAAAAADALLNSEVPLVGTPPQELVLAIAATDELPHDSLLNLARAWSRSEMSRAALDALHQDPDARTRERLAWLLKTVLAEEHVPEAIDVAVDHSEDPQVRAWTVEALERLAFSGAIGWDQLSGVVDVLAEEPSSTLRAALASLLMALEWRPTSSAMLEPLLRDPDPEVIAAAAHTLAGHPDAVRRLDSRRLDQLRRDQNPWLRHAAAELDASLQ